MGWYWDWDWDWDRDRRSFLHMQNTAKYRKKETQKEQQKERKKKRSMEGDKEEKAQMGRGKGRGGSRGGVSYRDEAKVYVAPLWRGKLHGLLGLTWFVVCVCVCVCVCVRGCDDKNSCDFFFFFARFLSYAIYVYM